MSTKRIVIVSVATYIVLSAFLLGFLKFSGVAVAGSLITTSIVPSLLAYQGSVSLGNGHHDMIFRIFDAEVDGNEVWSEDHTVASGNPVAVVRREFTVILGEINPLGLDVFSSAERWLEIEVNGNPQSPRQRFTSAAYAFRAGEAELANSVPDGSITQAQAPTLIQGPSSGERIEYGTGTWSGEWSPNPAAGTWYRNTHITFSTPFSEPPRVFVNLSSNNPEAWGIGGDTTTTGFDARNVAVVLIPSTDSDTFDWIAIGK